MKLLKLLILTLTILTFNSYLYAQDYYYYKGQQIQLTQEFQFVNIVTSSSFDESQLTAIGVEPFTMVSEYTPINGEYKKIAKIEFTSSIDSESAYNVKVAQLKSLSGLEGVNPYFTNNGHTFGTSHRFLVKLNQPSDLSNLQSYASSHNLIILDSIPTLPNWIELACTVNTTGTSIEEAATIYETGNYAASEPGFTDFLYLPESPMVNAPQNQSSLTTCSNEPYANQQWNLFDNPNSPMADINVCGAWAETTGNINVKIAIFDQGAPEGFFEYDVFSSNVIQASPLPFQSNFLYGNHGKLVAGISSSWHQELGIAGISPNTSLLHVANPLPPTLIQSEIATGIGQAVSAGANVMNMSWGNSGTPSSILADAFDNAMASDVVLVAAVGNDAQQNVSYPANYPGILAVGASNIAGEPAAWATHGPEMDLMAPSGVPVMQNQNSGPFTFIGTSASSPHVTGIVGLMKSASQGIKADAIKNIVRRTAQKSGEGTIIDGEPVVYEPFLDLSLGSKNEATGYGIPNATACVLTAKEFETAQGELDVHIRNSVNDFGKEPDNVTKHANYEIWTSPDIWIPFDTGTEFYENRNPLYQGPGSTETVIVRVINKSNEAVPINSLNVKLYWSKFGGNTSNWPENWDGSEFCNGVPIGGPVGNPNGQYNTLSSIEPGEQGLYFFIWDVPNPEDFVGCFADSDSNEFSLLARIDSNDDPMTFGEGDNIWTNTRNNNNIAWKSVVVVENSPYPTPNTGIVNITNNETETKDYKLEFGVSQWETGKHIYEEAEVTIQLENELYQEWYDSGAIVENVQQNGLSFKAVDDQVIFDDISLEPGETRSLTLSFNFLADELSNKKEFYYHFAQRDKTTDDIVYGKSFIVKKGDASSFDADAGDDKEINKNESTTLSAESIGEPATYNWYDPEGNLIFTGQDITVSPELTQQYTLEVIKDSDGVKDYDEVSVEVNPFVLGAIAPNPAQLEVAINYTAEDANSAYIIMTELNTNSTYNHILDTQVGQATIDLYGYNTGIYFVTLVCDGVAIDTQQLIIE